MYFDFLYLKAFFCMKSDENESYKNKTVKKIGKVELKIKRLRPY